MPPQETSGDDPETTMLLPWNPPVRRHGPMVLGVCRRLLPDINDAEDAFQATFLVLIRKAATIGKRELLANWLFGVARRTAMQIRKATARGREKERQVRVMPQKEVVQDEAIQDMLPLLDQAGGESESTRSGNTRPIRYANKRGSWETSPGTTWWLRDHSICQTSY